ncbi:MAG: DUF3795 domain-containing protein [Planctomycetota bacterium]
MKEILGRCGYRCDLCRAYGGNIKSDADKQRTCEAFAKYFGAEMKPEDMGRCAGCLKGDGDPDCEVRPCADEKGLENCAHCEIFACEKLKARMRIVADKVKDISSIPEEDYNLFIKPYLGEERLLKVREGLTSA